MMVVISFHTLWFILSKNAFSVRGVLLYIQMLLFVKKQFCFCDKIFINLHD